MKIWKELWKTQYAQKQMKKGTMPLEIYYNYEGNHTMPYDLLVGFESKEEVEGFESIEIPKQKYQVFQKTGNMPEVVFEYWQEVWQSDIKRSFTYDIEEYPNTNSTKLLISLN